jgi:hypothetical protein
MNHLDPYDLLGVSPYAPAPDVRRAYYQLALLAHPDKGGSAADMATVRAAYNYVIARAPATPLAPNAELAERAANAAREFTEFLAAQRTERILPLNEILANAFGLTEASFVADYLQPALDAAAMDAATSAARNAHDRAAYANVAYQTVVSRAHAQLAAADSFGCNHSAIIAELTTDFVATTHAPGSARCFPAAIAGGYGDVMEPAGLMPRTGPLTPFPERQVIHYAEPDAFVPPAGPRDCSRPADVELPAALDDYTVHSALTDYRAAYTAPEPFPPFSAAAAGDTAAAPADLLTAYERLVADRIAEDLQNSMDIVESH